MHIPHWMRAGVLSLAAVAPPLIKAAPALSPERPAAAFDRLPLVAMPALAAPIVSLPVVLSATAISLPPGVALASAADLPAARATASPFSGALSEGALDAYRGGTDLVSNDAHLSGLVGENAATNVSTGGNTIDGASFANVSGIPVVIQNSGANVLIQNSTIVNLQLK